MSFVAEPDGRKANVSGSRLGSCPPPQGSVVPLSTHTMNAHPSHYLLYLEAGFPHDAGRWRFTLRKPDGSLMFEACDSEPEIQGDRLALLTVVRALETLDEPAKVTLVGCHRYVKHGMMYGLAEWRENGFRWECFGEMKPVKNADLWQRLDQALRFHEVICQLRRIDPPHAIQEPKHNKSRGGHVSLGIRGMAENWLKCAIELTPAELRARLGAWINHMGQWMLPVGGEAVGSP